MKRVNARAIRVPIAIVVASILITATWATVYGHTVQVWLNSGTQTYSTYHPHNGDFEQSCDATFIYDHKANITRNSSTSVKFNSFIVDPSAVNGAVYLGNYYVFDSTNSGNTRIYNGFNGTQMSASGTYGLNPSHTVASAPGFEPYDRMWFGLNGPWTLGAVCNARSDVLYMP